MDCETARLMIPRLVDAELPGADRRRLDDHLANCDDCRRACEGERVRAAVVRDNAQRFSAPLALRARLASALAEADRAREPAARERARLWRWLAPLATGVAGCMLGALVAVQLLWVSNEQRIRDDIVDNHVRSLMTAHLTDVESSNRHNVKPWFAGRVAFSPPVVDLSHLGFALDGGRVEYVDRRAAAAIVYRRGAHVINAYVWVADGAPGTRSAAYERDGYHVIVRRLPQRVLYAVSDLNAAELAQFADALAAAIERGDS